MSLCETVEVGVRYFSEQAREGLRMGEGDGTMAKMAEGQGFEPWDGLPSPVFKTGAFGHSATPPFEAGLYRLKSSKQEKLYSFSCSSACASSAASFL